MIGMVFDLETYQLDAVSGYIMLGAFKEVDPPGKYDPKKLHIYRYDLLGDAPGREVRLIKAILKEISQYQLWIGHNARGFDWPMIKSRAVRLGIHPPIAPAFVYDTMLGFRRVGFRTVPNIVGKPTSRLDMVVDFFGMQQLKTAIYPAMHAKCVFGKPKERKEAMDSLEDHCRKDIEMTEEAYWQILPYDPTGSLKRVW